MAVDLTKLIDFDLLKRYDTNLKNWIEKKFVSENKLVFITENSLPNVGDMTVLYVTEDAIQLWNGSEYIKVGGQGTGATFIPSIDKNGDLTWTNNAGLPNPRPVNIMGPAGKDGIIGKDGKSAYDIAVDNGFTGSEADWLESLKGTDGVNGASFTIKGLYATVEELKTKHPTGKDGDAYAIGDSDYNEIYNWSEEEQEWQNLGSLEGPAGPKGEDSIVPGPQGDSAYDIAVAEGFEGTEAEWLESLKGADGDQGEDGKSAYEIAKESGFDGTEEEWLESLKGDSGEDGVQGISIKDAKFDQFNHLIITLDDEDETTIDAGEINVELAEITKQEYVNVSIKSSAIDFNGTDYTYVFPTEEENASVYINGIRLKKDVDYTLDEDNNITFTLLYDSNDQCYIEWFEKGEEEDLWATSDDISSLFN